MAFWHILVKPRMKAAAWVAVASAIGLCSTDSPAQPEDLSKAEAMVRRGDFEAAERRLWEIVAREPNRADAIHLLGRVRLRQKRYGESEALLQRALALDPALIDAHRDLAGAYAAQGKDEPATIEYGEVLKLRPLDREANAAMAALLQRKREFQRSLDFALKIPSVQRPNFLLPALATDYLELGHPDQVTSLLPEVLRRSGADPELAAQFGNVLVNYGLVDDAGDLATAVLRRRRATPSLLLLRARAEEHKGERARARQSLERALKLDPEAAEVLAEAGRLAALDADWQEAAELLGRAAAREPHHVEVMQRLVVASLHARQNDEAVSAARKLSAIRPDEPETLNLLGAALVENREWTEALPVVTRLVEVRPDDAKARLALGIVQFHLQDAGARTTLERCLEQDPNEAEAAYYLGLLARQQGDATEGVKRLQRAIELNPRHVSALSLLATLYMQAGQLERARQALEQAVRLAPDNRENHYQLALVYSRLGLAGLAQQEMKRFERLRTAAPGQPAQDPAQPATSNHPRRH